MSIYTVHKLCRKVCQLGTVGYYHMYKFLIIVHVLPNLVSFVSKTGSNVGCPVSITVSSHTDLSTDWSSTR